MSRRAGDEADRMRRAVGPSPGPRRPARVPRQAVVTSRHASRAASRAAADGLGAQRVDVAGQGVERGHERLVGRDDHVVGERLEHLGGVGIRRLGRRAAVVARAGPARDGHGERERDGEGTVRRVTGSPGTAISLARALASRATEGIAGGLRLAAVPEDRLLEVARAAVVEEAGVAVDGLDEADAPQRWRAPLRRRSTRRPAGAVVGEVGAQVVEQEVGVGADGLPVQRGDVRRGPCAARRRGRSRSRSRRRALGPPAVSRRLDVAASRDGQRAACRRSPARACGRRARARRRSARSGTRLAGACRADRVGATT